MMSSNKLLRKARKGTRVVLIPGNHDEYFRDLAGHRFGQMSIVEDAIHVTATDGRYLVLHGDKFDGVQSTMGLSAPFSSAAARAGASIAGLASRSDQA